MWLHDRKLFPSEFDLAPCGYQPHQYASTISILISASSDQDGNEREVVCDLNGLDALDSKET